VTGWNWLSRSSNQWVAGSSPARLTYPQQLKSQLGTTAGAWCAYSAYFLGSPCRISGCVSWPDRLQQITGGFTPPVFVPTKRNLPLQPGPMPRTKRRSTSVSVPGAQRPAETFTAIQRRHVGGCVKSSRRFQPVAALPVLIHDFCAKPPMSGLTWALATALCKTREAAADGEECRGPLDGLPRVGFCAVGEFDEELAVELVGACPRCCVETAHARSAGRQLSLTCLPPRASGKRIAAELSTAPGLKGFRRAACLHIRGLFRRKYGAQPPG
jgi:hypothetical protein